MMQKIILSLMLLFVFQIQAQDSWKVNSYTIGFTIKHAMGATAEGTIGNLKADIIFSPDKLSFSKISASVDVATIKTGNSTRDKVIKGETYFNTTKFPQISMKLSRVTSKGGNRYVGKFNLTIKAVTKEVEIPFTFSPEGITARLEGTFKINRLDYSVGESSWMLGDDVNINIKMELIKQ